MCRLGCIDLLYLGKFFNFYKLFKARKEIENRMEPTDFALDFVLIGFFVWVKYNLIKLSITICSLLKESFPLTTETIILKFGLKKYAFL